MKRILFIVSCFLMLLFIVGCSNNTAKLKTKEASTEKTNIEELDSIKSNKLTLDIVIQLSQKGDKLSWEDFQTYNGTEIGFGLYVRQYPVDDKYTILVGGGSLKEKPMYIYLVNNETKDNEIDIRYDDVAKFINNAPK